jgi:hypothetical protein
MEHQRRRRWVVLRASRCVCGLRWPCPDRYLWPPETPIPDGSPTPSPTWNGPTTQLYQPGRAGTLTPAQASRAAQRPHL